MTSSRLRGGGRLGLSSGGRSMTEASTSARRRRRWEARRGDPREADRPLPRREGGKGREGREVRGAEGRRRPGRALVSLQGRGGGRGGLLGHHREPREEGDDALPRQERGGEP